MLLCRATHAFLLLLLLFFLKQMVCFKYWFILNV